MLLATAGCLHQASEPQTIPNFRPDLAYLAQFALWALARWGGASSPPFFHLQTVFAFFDAPGSVEALPAGSSSSKELRAELAKAAGLGAPAKAPKCVLRFGAAAVTEAAAAAAAASSSPAAPRHASDRHPAAVVFQQVLLSSGLTPSELVELAQAGGAHGLAGVADTYASAPPWYRRLLEAALFLVERRSTTPNPPPPKRARTSSGSGSSSSAASSSATSSCSSSSH